MSRANVAINGLGRIGRAVLKIVLETPELELVAVNDIAAPEALAYLLRHDTVYGRWHRQVSAHGDRLIVDGQGFRLIGERDPLRLPWRDLGVDVVLECTGAFGTRDGLEKHIRAGARAAILSAPAKGADVPTVVFGVNRADEAVRTLSCASCTTNCITPVAEVMDRRIGVEKAIMTTVHAYTASQAIVDAPRGHLERGRAGASNLVPTSTGAAAATTRALPSLQGRFDGVAVRAPVPVGSIADVVFVASRRTNASEVNGIFREEAESDRYRGVLGVSDEPLVSSDIVRDPRAAVVDLAMTRVVDGDLVKVMAWYDNEWGYASQMIREAVEVARSLARRG
jgi:glyceraldehyde 3-phosphate dehydrogenase (phosphorylating)